MKTNGPLLLVFSFIVFFSCTKEETAVDKLHSLTRLAVGNYWVYDVFKVESGGMETLVTKDSSVVRKDSILNGKRYFVLERSSALRQGRFVELLRDSGEYLIDHHGTIYISSQRSLNLFTKYVKNNTDTIAQIDYLIRGEAYVNVGTGSYIAETLHSVYYTLANPQDKRTFKTSYARGVGEYLKAILTPINLFILKSD